MVAVEPGAGVGCCSSSCEVMRVELMNENSMDSHFNLGSVGTG